MEKYPDKKYFNPDGMKPSVHKEFSEWYENVRNTPFDYQKERLLYCVDDVSILIQGARKFRESLIELENYDPLCDITKAGVAMNVFLANHMRPNTIGVVNTHKCEKYSKISIQWLEYLAARNNVYIEHALNGGERTIKGVGKIDGYCLSTNTIYEFQGCWWHGCEWCYHDDTKNKKCGMTMSELRKRTENKNVKIRNLGYNLVEVRECDLKKDNEFQGWIKDNNYKVVTPLDPRDALFGGRTNAIKLKMIAPEGYRIMYKDIMSLYPFINRNGKYPVGHPETIVRPKKWNENWYGIAKVKILPPMRCFHPVLLVKVMTKNTHKDNESGKQKVTRTEKLLFPLCRTCAEQMSGECDHDVAQRSFIGTWSTPEIAKAVEKGYEILEIFEVYHFQQTSTELFSSYIDRFVKVKMESSKPTYCDKRCDDDCKKHKTLIEFKKYVSEHMGIDVNECVFNPGARQHAKLMLNSLWGKFGQRERMSKRKLLSSVDELMALILDDKIESFDTFHINEEILGVNYVPKNKNVENVNKTNVYVALFTTALARLELYKYLEKLDDRVLYFDTDCVIYLEKEGKDLVPDGDLLRDMENELGFNKNSEFEFITEFYSLGPKTYSYITNLGNTCFQRVSMTTSVRVSQ